MLKNGIICALAALLAIALSGCSSSVPRRAGGGWVDEGAEVGSQGASWEVVFATPETQRGLTDAGLDDPESRWEFSRRDYALNPQGNGPILATDEWPTTPRVDLTRPWRINLPDRADDYLFFVPRGTYYPNRSWRWYGY